MLPSLLHFKAHQQLLRHLPHCGLIPSFLAIVGFTHEPQGNIQAHGHWPFGTSSEESLAFGFRG